jgi:hypothetical protein
MTLFSLQSSCFWAGSGRDAVAVITVVLVWLRYFDRLPDSVLPSEWAGLPSESWYRRADVTSRTNTRRMGMLAAMMVTLDSAAPQMKRYALSSRLGLTLEERFFRLLLTWIHRGHGRNFCRLDDGSGTGTSTGKHPDDQVALCSGLTRCRNSWRPRRRFSLSSSFGVPKSISKARARE